MFVSRKTPIVYTIKKRDTKMTEQVLINGADIKHPEVLYTAVKNGRLKFVEDLLKNGADPNVIDKSNLFRGQMPLYIAVHWDQVEIAKLLIKYGADVNVKDREGKTPIIYAIRKKNTEMIELLLTNGADIKEDPMVLCEAVMCGNLKIVEDLLKDGTDVNRIYYLKLRVTLLHIAISLRQMEVAKLLIKYGAYVNIKDCIEISPILHAIQNSYTEMTELLLINGADIKEDPKILYTAVEKGNLKIVENLLKDDTDVNMIIHNSNSSFNGMTLLHCAVNVRQVEVAELLLNYGANVNVKDSKGITPILYAIEKRDIKMTEQLLMNGADIKDPKVLYTAIQKGTPKIVECLLKNGADPNLTHNSILNNAWTPVHEAVVKNQVEMVKLLIKYGADVNVKSRAGATPIVGAIQERNTEMIELLLTNGADVKEDPTVLCAAAAHGCLKLVEDLLKDGADVNMIDNSNLYKDLTPLHSAVRRNKVKMVKLLIKYGADVNVKSRAGATPIVGAIQGRNTQMIELLLTNGADVKEDPMVLCAAAAHGCLKLVEDLLTNDADPNMTDNSILFKGQTPLHSAACKKQVESAKLLIKYGAYVNTKDYEGHTPIFHAIRNEDTGMIELLLTNGAAIKEDVNTNLLRVDSPVPKILKQHIAKVKAAGLYVSERNLLWISNDHEINNFLNECEAEIQIMKSEKIDNSCASFYDILTKNTSELAKNKSIVQALKYYIYKTKFPIYASMIDSRFRRGLEREELLEQVRKKFLHSLFESFPEVPCLCTEKIFSYLSDRDLRILLVRLL